MKDYIKFGTEFLAMMIIFLLITTLVDTINKTTSITHNRINPDVLLVLGLLYSINLTTRIIKTK